MFMLGGRCQTDAIDIMISQLKKGKTNVCVGRGVTCMNIFTLETVVYYAMMMYFWNDM